LSKNPYDSKLYNTKGQIYFGENNFEKAIDCFNKAIEYNPNEPGYIVNKELAKKELNISVANAIRMNPKMEAYINKNLGKLI